MNGERSANVAPQRPRIARVAREMREKAKMRRRKVLAKLRDVLDKAKREGAVRPKVSDLLASIADGSADDAITLGELAGVLGRRSFGFLLILLGILAVIPSPPGFSSVVGVPIFFFGLQLLTGRRRPWLPTLLRRRTFTRSYFARLLYVSERYIRYVESFSWPRLPIVVWALSPHVAGATLMLLSFFIIAPVPFGGILPAVAVVIIALALIEGDGLMLLFGLIGAALALFVSTALAAGTLHLAAAALVRLFGL